MIVLGTKIQPKHSIPQCNFEPEFAVLLKDKISYTTHKKYSSALIFAIFATWDSYI